MFETGERVHIENGPKRVRTYIGGEFIADTKRLKLVWEVPFTPAACGPTRTPGPAQHLSSPYISMCLQIRLHSRLFLPRLYLVRSPEQTIGFDSAQRLGSQRERRQTAFHN